MTKEELALKLERTKVTQRELAAACGESEGNVSYYLSGRHEIQEDFAEKAEAFLNEKADELLRNLLADREPALATAGKE